MFIHFTDTLVGHDGEMIRPKLAGNFDFEGELTAVLGKGGRSGLISCGLCSRG